VDAPLAARASDHLPLVAEFTADAVDLGNGRSPAGTLDPG
jgi:hypothetical protein